MHNYSTLQIESIAILILFFFYFGFKIRAFFKHFKKQKGFLQANRTLKKLQVLPWDDFEHLCMELFSQEGWKTKGNSKKGADGGVDIWMRRGGVGQKSRHAIVQCKRYNNAVVGIKIIREMYGLMYEHKVDVAYVVTTSRFTKECYKFVKGKEIILIDGKKLLQMINKY